MKKQFAIVTIIVCVLTSLIGSLNAANPFRRSFHCNDCSLFDGTVTVGADWLYWKVTEDNLVIGSNVSNADSTSDTPVAVNASTIGQNFKYDSGVRVNLGYSLPCECWDLNVIWTYIPGHSKSSPFETTDPEESSFTPNLFDFPIINEFINQGSILPPTSVNSKWHLSFNNIDVNLGRTIGFGECLKFRPYIGFRTTWFNQKFKLLALPNIPDNPIRQVLVVKLDEDFRACGVVAGLWGGWDIGCGLSFIGHFGGSVLYSNFNLQQSGVGINVGDDPGELIRIHTCDFFRNATPTVDYFAGLQYEACYCGVIIGAHVGWEQHIYFDVNRLTNAGNMSAQGLTLGLNLSF